MNFDDISKVFTFHLGVAFMTKCFFPRKIISVKDINKNMSF